MIGSARYRGIRGPAERRCARGRPDRLVPGTADAYRVPVRVVFVDQLPRNEVGKVVKRELAALADA